MQCYGKCKYWLWSDWGTERVIILQNFSKVDRYHIILQNLLQSFSYLHWMGITILAKDHTYPVSFVWRKRRGWLQERGWLKQQEMHVWMPSGLSMQKSLLLQLPRALGSRGKGGRDWPKICQLLRSNVIKPYLMRQSRFGRQKGPS